MKIGILSSASSFVVKKNVKDNISFKNNLRITQDVQNDVFIKSKEVSFKGIDDYYWKTSLALGGGFLGILILGIKAAELQNPSDVFTQDGQFIGHFNADTIEANRQEAEKLGIDLNLDRFKGAYCICDPINGVYKNYNKGIDIDLEKGKYIDLDKGIYINPDDKTSVIYTGGDAVPVLLPSANPSFQGASVLHGGGTGEGFIAPIGNRNDFLKNHDGEGPENYNDDVPWTFKSHEDLFPPQDVVKEAAYASFGIPLKYNPADRRSFPEKFHDAIFGKDGSSPYLHDMWGRDIVKVSDAAGKPHYVALSEDLAQRIHDEQISYETVQKFIAHSAEHPIKTYITEHYMHKIENMHFENPDIEHFIDNIKDSLISYDHNINSHNDSTYVDSNDQIYHDNDFTDPSSHNDNYNYTNYEDTSLIL